MSAKRSEREGSMISIEATFILLHFGSLTIVLVHEFNHNLEDELVNDSTLRAF